MLTKNIVRDLFFFILSSSFSMLTGLTRFELLFTFLARLHKQKEFSNTSLKTKDTKTKGCLIDVIITERQISCMRTPVKLIAGMPSDPKVRDVMASTPYSKVARRMKKTGIRRA